MRTLFLSTLQVHYRTLWKHHTSRTPSVLLYSIRYTCQDDKPCLCENYSEVQKESPLSKLLQYSDTNHLINISNQLKERIELRTVAKEQGITGKLYEEILTSFTSLIQQPLHYKDNVSLLTTLYDIIQGNGHVDNLFNHFINHAHKCYPMLYVLPQLMKISNLTSPAQWFPAARSMKRHFIIHAGPTNSGKTHHALKTFFEAETAVYCAPLRMLAAEIYQLSNDKGVSCDLVTGEQRRYASGDSEVLSSHVACTVEMVSTTVGTEYDVAVIDEAQMLRDRERGGAWTRAILGVPAKEIHLCGEPTVIPIIQKIVQSLGDTIEVKHYERLTPLVPLSKSLHGNFKFIKPGDCVVAFSRNDMFKIKEEIEKSTRKPCAIVYGALPSANRQQQAKIFNSSKSSVNIMVATDAIGMGLNLKIKRIIFYTLMKRDNKVWKYLSPSHVKQIAGRAGRYGRYDRGEVTTFNSEDLSFLHQLLSFPINNIKRAGLTPKYEQLELFSNHLPKLRLHELLLVFNMTTKLDDTYFLCETAMEEWMEKSQLLTNIKLDLKDAFTLSMSPVSSRNPYIKNSLCEYAKYVSEKIPLNYTELQKFLNWPLPQPVTPLEMTQLEDTHEVLHLYLWLGQRYPDIFPDTNEVCLMQKEIEKSIEKSLSSRKKLLKVHPLKSRNPKKLLNEEGPVIIPHALYWRSYKQKSQMPKYGEPFKKNNNNNNKNNNNNNKLKKSK